MIVPFKCPFSSSGISQPWGHVRVSRGTLHLRGVKVVTCHWPKLWAQQCHQLNNFSKHGLRVTGSETVFHATKRAWKRHGKITYIWDKLQLFEAAGRDEKYSWYNNCSTQPRIQISSFFEIPILANCEWKVSFCMQHPSVQAHFGGHEPLDPKL